MSELNREQIIKALECHSNNLFCIDCPYQATDKYLECSSLTLNALSLIKELTEDNEYLKTALTDCEARYDSRKESDLEEVLELRLKVDELTEENERLEKVLVEQSAENVMLIGENKRLKERVLAENHLRHQAEEMLANGMSVVKTDTVRKMQERLKEAPIKVGLPLLGLQTKDEVEDYANGLILQMRDAIDQIAKEMLDDAE